MGWAAGHLSDPEFCSYPMKASLAFPFSLQNTVGKGTLWMLGEEPSSGTAHPWADRLGSASGCCRAVLGVAEAGLH